jgi:hypothetical protein
MHLLATAYLLELLYLPPTTLHLSAFFRPRPFTPAPRSLSEPNPHLFVPLHPRGSGARGPGTATARSGSRDRKPDHKSPTTDRDFLAGSRLLCSMGTPILFIALQYLQMAASLQAHHGTRQHDYYGTLTTASLSIHPTSIHLS